MSRLITPLWPALRTAARRLVMPVADPIHTWCVVAGMGVLGVGALIVLHMAVFR